MRLNRNIARIHLNRFAFTLVEVLVVLLLLLILASIALPGVKTMISDQQISRSARGITAYIDVARNRAISEGRHVGILVERFGDDTRGRAHSIRLRQLTSVPPYAGDASNAVAVLQLGGASATFDPSSNQLLALSASMVADPGVVGDVDDPNAPIRNGDYIELPGGRVVPFVITFRDLTAAATVPVFISFDMTELRDGTEIFPAAERTILAPRNIKYKIHRRPIVSTTAPFSLPRGVVIDLNYSGFGVSGNQFAPDNDGVAPLEPAYDVSVIFGPDGKIVSITDPATGILVPPIGQIFFCIGDADGMREDNLFAQETKATASLLNLKSIWLVMNPGIGRAVASPIAPVSTIPGGVITDPTDASLAIAIAESRLFANFSDTVDTE